MSRRALFLLAPLLGALLGTSSHAAAAPRAQLAARALAARAPARHASFDWDDNTVVMTTHMYLRSKVGAPELALTTAEWTHAKYLVGKPGPLEDRYLDPDRLTGGFRNFGENGKENLFLRDLKQTVTGKRSWRGPSWEAFVQQLSTRTGARRASLITAREHSADSMFEGLRYLQSLGLIKHLPPRENLFAVNRPGIAIAGKPLAGSTPERKLLVQRALLDALQHEAQAAGGMQKWHFSDDDWANYAATRDGLAPDVKAGRWSRVDIKLHFTGLDDPHNAPQSMKLRRL